MKHNFNGNKCFFIYEHILSKQRITLWRTIFPTWAQITVVQWWHCISKRQQHCTFLQENNRVLTITNTNNSNHSYKKHLISSLTKTNFKRLSNHDILLYKNYFNDINNTKHKANITLNILNTFIPNYDNSRHSTAIHLRVTSSHTMLTISRYNP